MRYIHIPPDSFWFPVSLFPLFFSLVHIVRYNEAGGDPYLYTLQDSQVDVSDIPSP